MTSTPKKQASAEKNSVTKTRVRLLPEVRRRQILDAALIEFGSLGFTAASISKIAQRAGTSKANLYVHFANKDEIFETLLRDLLAPSQGFWQHVQGDLNLDDQIDTFIDKTYAGLTPQAVEVIRLVISESHRVPALIQRWHEETVMPARAEQQRQIDQYVAKGEMFANPLTDNFSFIMAPVLYAAVAKMIFDPNMAESEYQKIKETHRKVLHMLLKPQT
ncbi:TetR/AcrR family transcriptional regulator [Herminiimonas arsenitoxidans]|uniref:TetR/AcrR family transcriptional regulator n=1 Tax=Herminiimonas arsenitoxidans TaxID=1809410 RepID=UPI0009706F2B|nr:TetR/AcrR family transcriptional regulator [Herminiimonas arsenitoxidans]